MLGILFFIFASCEPLKVKKHKFVLTVPRDFTDLCALQNVILINFDENNCIKNTTSHILRGCVESPGIIERASC